MLASLAERRYVAKAAQRTVYDADGDPHTVCGYWRYDGSFIVCRSWSAAVAAAHAANDEAV